MPSLIGNKPNQVPTNGDLGSMAFEDNENYYTNAETDALLVTAVPAGTVIHVAMNAAPTGYLKANGALVSRTTFATLFAAIGTTFGAGNGSTTFALPDLRGEFLRGWDDGRGVDSGRALGSAQGDAFGSHNHTGTANSAGAHTHGLSVQSQASGRGTENNNVTRIGSSSTGSAGNHSHSLSINSTGGTETRPRNVALLACIKF